MSTITAARTVDIRFPTSNFLDGSDAMNPDPDYSAAYPQFTTDSEDGLSGHRFVFTIGLDNDIETKAISGLCERVQHLSVFDFIADSRTMEGRMIEFADHLREHMVTPVAIVGGRYRPLTAPGSGAEILESSIAGFTFPASIGRVEITASGEGH